MALQEKDDSVRQARKALQLARERKIKVRHSHRLYTAPVSLIVGAAIQISKAIKRQDVQDQLAKLKKIALRTKVRGAGLSKRCWKCSQAHVSRF